MEQNLKQEVSIHNGETSTHLREPTVVEDIKDSLEKKKLQQEGTERKYGIMHITDYKEEYNYQKRNTVVKSELYLSGRRALGMWLREEESRECKDYIRHKKGKWKKK